jgi:hypothetical protein
MTWALKRQLTYVFFLIIFLGSFAYLLIRPSLNKAPTCVDGIQNGTEAGIDCGGGCATACLNQVDAVSIIWARSFEVITGRYNAVAYLENHNQDKVVQKINYRFRFADKDNVYIGKREGTAFIPAGQKFAVFEPGIDIGNSIPVYTTFDFISTPTWVTVPGDRLSQIKVLPSNIRLSNTDTTPIMAVTLTNTSLFTIPRVNVITILYDASNNAVASSSSYLDQMAAQESTDVNFTWPEPFKSVVVSKEIIPIFNIFDAKLK